MSGALTYVAVGHLCVDELHDAPERLGGTVYFSAAQAAAMGCEVSIVTSCTADTAARARRSLPDGVALEVLGSGEDTRFRFGPDADVGPLGLVSTAQMLDVVPDDLLPDVLHLAPVFNELSPALIATARDHARFVGATPQGLLRGTTPQGALRFVADHWPAVADFADAIVLNDAEHDHLGGIGLLDDFPGLVFRTCGPEGAALFHGGVEVARVELEDSPPVPPQRTIGAGDVFAAAAFVALARGDLPEAALDVAVRSATAYVQRPTDDWSEA